jgi:hypothetical protein
MNIVWDFEIIQLMHMLKTKPDITESGLMKLARIAMLRKSQKNTLTK